MLLPVHVVFLELIIDPACSVAFEAEPEEADVMLRPPRDTKEPLFNRRTVVFSLLQGAAVLGITLAVYAITLGLGRGDTEARTPDIYDVGDRQPRADTDQSQLV
jgi:Ca2+-transporting ATPase